MNNNKSFLIDRMSDAIETAQVQICKRVANQAVLGFVGDSNFECELAIMALLNNALDNAQIYSDEQFSNIINLYNKVSYVR